LGTKKATHIGGASGHHGPKLHKLVAVPIIEIQPETPDTAPSKQK